MECNDCMSASEARRLAAAEPARANTKQAEKKKAESKKEAEPVRKSEKKDAEKLREVIKPRNKENYRLDGLLTPAYKSYGI